MRPPFVVIAVSSLVLAAATAAAAAAAARPNVVLFVPDELRAESMGLYGGPAATPNYARLAAQGTSFSRAFSTYPVCTQSRSSFLTGRYTHSAGHRSLWDPLRFWEPNLLAYAKQSNYSVFMAGKNDAMDLPSFNKSVSQAGEWGLGTSGPNAYVISDPRYYSFISNETGATPATAHDGACVDHALDFLEARNASGDARPFFVFLPLISPHPPYGCPAPFYGFSGAIPTLRPSGLPGKPDFHERIRFYRNATKWPSDTLETVQRLYLGCVEYSDWVLGRMLDGLERLGLDASNTAFVVTSDHGDYGGDFGLVEKWPSGLEDVLLNVPLIMRVPGGVAGQRVDGALVQHMDLTPTLLEAMQVPLQHVQFGVSQMPVLTGTAAPDESRVAFAEGGYGTLEPRDFEGDCADPLRSLCDPASIYYPKGVQEWAEKLTVCRSYMVRTQTHKLVRRSDALDADHDSELYDLVEDPRELNNVYSNASYAGVRAELTTTLLEWMLQTSAINTMPFAGSRLGLDGSQDEIPRLMPSGNWSVR
jgi:arylsulfatase A-like enzyme